jgi:hypothetical protein
MALPISEKTADWQRVSRAMTHQDFADSLEDQRELGLPISAEFRMAQRLVSLTRGTAVAFSLMQRVTQSELLAGCLGAFPGSE